MDLDSSGLYLVIPSNGAPDNTLSEFHTTLPQPLKVENCEIALVEAVFPSHIDNVPEPLDFTINYGSFTETYALEPGAYSSAEVFIESLQGLLTRSNVRRKRGERFLPDERGKRSRRETFTRWDPETGKGISDEEYAARLAAFHAKKKQAQNPAPTEPLTPVPEVAAEAVVTSAPQPVSTPAPVILPEAPTKKPDKVDEQSKPVVTPALPPTTALPDTEKAAVQETPEPTLATPLEKSSESPEKQAEKEAEDSIPPTPLIDTQSVEGVSQGEEAVPTELFEATEPPATAAPPAEKAEPPKPVKPTAVVKPSERDDVFNTLLSFSPFLPDFDKPATLSKPVITEEAQEADKNRTKITSAAETPIVPIQIIDSPARSEENVPTIAQERAPAQETLSTPQPAESDYRSNNNSQSRDPPNTFSERIVPLPTSPPSVTVSADTQPTPTVFSVLPSTDHFLANQQREIEVSNRVRPFDPFSDPTRRAQQPPKAVITNGRRFASDNEAPIRFHYEKATERVSLFIQDNRVVSLIMHPDLAYMLGFTETVITDNVQAAYRTDLRGSQSMMYIYLDSIYPRIHGTAMTTLLRAVSLPERSSSGSVTHSFHALQYCRLRSDILTDIRVSILDGVGRNVRFSSGTVVLTLHIRRHSFL